MSAAIRSYGTALASGSRTNSTLPAPSSITNGDVLVAFLQVGGSTSPAVTKPAGWTEITSTGYPITYSRADPWEVKNHVYWKVASSESGNYLFTHSAGTSEGIVFAVSGANTTTPINPTATAFADSNNSLTTVTAPGLTTAVDDSVVFFLAGDWNDMTTSPPTGSTPTFTEYRDGEVFYVAAGVMGARGATGDKTITIGASEYACGAGLVCVEAAASGAGLTFSSSDGAANLTDALGGLRTMAPTFSDNLNA
jgi:hypothetical protein